MRQAVLVAVLFILGSSLAFGISKSYDVVPFGGCVAEIVTSPNYGITQYYRNTLDSITMVSFWVGDKGNGEAFTVEVRDSATNYLIADTSGVVPTRSWCWLNMQLQSSQTHKPIRGRTYRANITRNNHPISFAYDPRDPYKYGHAVANNSSPSLPEGSDLALRVTGLHDEVDTMDFGADECSWFTLPNHDFDPSEFVSRIETAHVRTVRFDIDWWLIQAKGPDSFDFGLFDSTMQSLDKDAGCRIVGLILYPPESAWASTRWDSVNDWSGGHLGWKWSPPRGLNYPVDNDSNLLARFLRRLIAHCDSNDFAIHHWEVLNEVNNEDTAKSTASIWQHPNRYYTDSLYVGPELRPMCSLYVRYAMVVDSVMTLDPDHQDDRIAVNSVNWLNTSAHDSTAKKNQFSGKEWLREFYDTVKDRGIETPFWDAISAHPYQETIPQDPPTTWPFGPGELEAHAETLRSIMREHGDYGELWNTEFSIPGFCWWNSTYLNDTVTTEQQDADYCCETFATAEGMKGLPGGCFDRNYWWLLRQRPGEGSWGLMDSFGNPHAALYACGQTAEQLVGKRFNGRVMTGDSVTDPLVRMYEFEDPADSHKTWVCWKSGDGGVSVSLPARSDTTRAATLDYDEDSLRYDKPVAANGWLPCTLTARPTFVAEPYNRQIRRPDLVVESLTVSPDVPHVHSWMDIRAYLKNTGNRATPESTEVKFFCNDSQFASYWIVGAIDSGETAQAVIVFYDVPQWMHGQSLFRAEANPGQKFVEKDGMDDNAGYARRYIAYGPGGDLIGELYGSHSNEPLPLLRLESHSYESDTLGSVPAESARLVQWVYGNDTIVDGGDTTAWFCVNQAVSLDTSWLYLSGQSKDKFFLQVKDSWSTSELIPDTTHPFVVFDTTGPTGSIVINGGAISYAYDPRETRV